MTEPIIYLSMFLGLGGVYVLISSFDDDDDGERFFKFRNTYLAR